MDAVRHGNLFLSGAGVGAAMVAVALGDGVGVFTSLVVGAINFAFWLRIQSVLEISSQESK